MNKSIGQTTVTIPELIVEKKIYGKNRLFQQAHKKEIVEVEIYHQGDSTYLLRDKIGRNFKLKLSRNKSETNPDKLISDISDISLLNQEVNLVWGKDSEVNITKDPDLIRSSWKNNFNFRQQTNDSFGLRYPQLGAIHSIASFLSLKSECGTIVMPTGTGKTEIMISSLVYGQYEKVLILVPSSVLRKQTVNKFLSLGCLREIGVVNEKVISPRVAMIESGIKDRNQVSDILNNANVIVVLSQSLKNFSVEAKQELSSKCSHLFIDEAHHVPAKTWEEIKDLFKDKPILQFTATPFRRDGKRIDGKIIYNYPLGLAQKDGYFKKINLIKIQEFDESKADIKIAKTAINSLKKDILDGKDHALMARCENKNRARDVIKIYQKLAPDLFPRIITSDLKQHETVEILSDVNSGKTKAIVCVDMLGEGFDLPILKIAALHDIHKSLAITLQFVGRFTRSSKNVGDATVVINTADPQVGKEMENLYSDDTNDWNALLKEKSESTIQKEIDFHEFIDNFSGELAKHISLWNLRPAFSTLIYETKCKNWHPNKFTEVIPKQYTYKSAVNDTEKILVIVVNREDEVNWGRYKDIKNHNYELCVIHWSEKHNALFIQSSDYDAFNCLKMSQAICGKSAKIKNGQKVFNIFSNVERTLARNLGVSTTGKISYTMHFGNDITSGLSKLDKSLGILNNIYGWGYEEGERVDRGCSAKKGKIWSRGGGPIILWKQWCHKIADKVFDNTIEENKITQDFLRPQALEKRYQSIPIDIQWSENILGSDEDSTTVYIGSKEYKVYDINLEVESFTDSGPIVFKVSSKDEEAIYKIEYGKNKCKYSLIKGNEVRIRRYSGEIISLRDYVEGDPLTVFYIDGSFSYNGFHVPTPKLNSFFDKSRLKTIDWSGTNIKIESMGKERNKSSIQYKIAQLIKSDYEVIINDDASGEAADLIALRQDSKDSLSLHLIHCKFSTKSKPGSRIEEFYALCGQAQKCIRWKHNGMDYLFKHVRNRENIWQKDGKTRFIKGNISDLNKLKKFSRFANKFNFEISIVQPGLLSTAVSEDIVQLLGSTEDYLIKTSGARFNVYCS